jgi:hypothetical protein
MSESLPGLPAGLDMPPSMTLLLSSSDEPVVISDGKTPGAMTLTRTLVPMNVVASILDRCVAEALELAYANWPELEPFIAPEMDVTLTTEEVYPGVLFPPFARRGKKVIDM